MLGQYHRVGNKTFVNAYAGLYESAKTQNFCEYVIPQYHLDRFLSVDVSGLQQYSTQNLIRKKLKVIRDTNSKIRFHYTGGRDSHTMLLTALDMGIKFDCLFTQTNSIIPDPVVEYEYVNGIEFAKQSDMYSIVHRPSIEDFELVWKDKLSFTKYEDFYHGFVPVYSEIFLRNYDTGYLELLGNDKPRYFIDNDGNYYWLIRDDYDYAIGTHHEDFFIGSVVPELAVKQVYLGYEYLKKYYNKTGFVDYKNLDRPKFCAYLGINQHIDTKISNSESVSEKSNLDHINYGYFNEKHRRTLLQVCQMDRHDIVDAWIETSSFICDSIKHAPYGIEKKTIMIPEINREVSLSTNTIRVGAIFKILPNRLELLPHTDINKL
jgi:hypothetical protein